MRPEMKIGVSVFDDSPARRWMLSSYEENLAREERKLQRKEKFKAQLQKFNTPVLHFKPTDDLRPELKDFLHTIETRSESNYGDCRWYASEMAEYFDVCTKTISRWLKKLESLDYISIISTPYHNKGRVYQNRVIRCKRIWRKYSFKVRGNLYSNEKFDIRPAKSRSEAIRLFPKFIDRSHLFPTDLIYDYTMRLIKKGQIDMDQFHMFEELSDSKKDAKIYSAVVSFTHFNAGWKHYLTDKNNESWREAEKLRSEKIKALEKVEKITVKPYIPKTEKDMEFQPVNIVDCVNKGLDVADEPTEKEIASLKRVALAIAQLSFQVGKKNFDQPELQGRYGLRVFLDWGKHILDECNVEGREQALAKCYRILDKYPHRTFSEILFVEQGSELE